MLTKSKSILITGASTGIGLGMAHQFVKNGYTVFGSVRKAADAEKLQQELGINFKPLIFDVTDEEGIKKAEQEVEKELNGQGLGGLINNAGIAAGGPLMHLPIGMVKDQFEVNVFGLIRVTQAFLPLLGARKSHTNTPGRILNISSVGGKICAPFIAPYVATKHAVEGISHSLRRELLLYGIDVIIIGPGAVVTPIWDKINPTDEFKDTDYTTTLDNFNAYFVSQGRKGLTIDEIGKQIYTIFEKKKPKTRYALVKNKFADWTIPSMMPDRWLDRIIGKSTGLLKK